jgi:PLP dependent protein
MIASNIHKLIQEIPAHVKLIAVSKTKPIDDVLEAYHAGQRAFGENKVQEMVAKYEQLPKDIEWHLIGHLQSNKVKYIAPFVHLIHSVDSIKLLETINKEAAKNNRIIDCLLQFHIAKEETKFGLSLTEALQFIDNKLFEACKNVRICGVMGMASFTENQTIISNEFRQLVYYFDLLKQYLGNYFTIKSFGMSGDYGLAIAEGSNMVRVGSHIFGERTL